jgi:hypothetical protein
VTVFFSEIDISVFCTDGLSRDDHTFQQAERILRQDASVLEGTGFAFVSVADDYFVVAGY